MRDIPTTLQDIENYLYLEQVITSDSIMKDNFKRYIECIRTVSKLLETKKPVKVTGIKSKCACGCAVYPQQKFCSECGRELQWVRNNTNRTTDEDFIEYF